MSSQNHFPADLPDKIISVEDVTQDIGRWANVNWIDVIETDDRGTFKQVICMVVETVDGKMASNMGLGWWMDNRKTGSKRRVGPTASPS